MRQPWPAAGRLFRKCRRLTALSVSRQPVVSRASGLSQHFVMQFSWGGTMTTEQG